MYMITEQTSVYKENGYKSKAIYRDMQVIGCYNDIRTAQAELKKHKTLVVGDSKLTTVIEYWLCDDSGNELEMAEFDI